MTRKPKNLRDAFQLAELEKKRWQADAKRLIDKLVASVAHDRDEEPDEAITVNATIGRWEEAKIGRTAVVTLTVYDQLRKDPMRVGMGANTPPPPRDVTATFKLGRSGERFTYWVRDKDYDDDVEALEAVRDLIVSEIEAKYGVTSP